MKEKIIKELNHFLEGNLMAIHAYENYIKRVKDDHIKHTLQEIQKEHKKHAAIVAERIQNLGGVAADDVGMKGKMVEFIQDVTGKTSGINDILRDAIAGEERGINVSKELVEGDLDEDSLQMVHNILEKDKEHVEILQKLLHDDG